MTRVFIPLCCALMPLQALAWEDVQTVEAVGEVTEGIDVDVPIGFSIDPVIVDPIWFGGVLTLSGTATPEVTLTTDATLSWGDLGVGTFEHTFTPIETALTLTSLASYSIAFEIRFNGPSGALLFDVELLGDELPWNEELGVADGALLPTDDPSVLFVDETGVDFPGLGFDTGGTVGISLQNGLTSEIKATAEVRGVAFRTLVQDSVSQDAPFDVPVGTPGLDVKVGYEATVDLDLAYEITQDPVFGIRIGPVTVPLTIPLKGERLEAISGTLDVEAVGEARHAFGRVDAIAAALPDDLASDETATVPLTVDNGGEGPLTVELVEVTGRDATDWRVPSDPQTLDAATSATLDLETTPLAGGDRFATLTVNTSDPWTPELTVDLSAVAAGDPPEDEGDDLGEGVGQDGYETCGCATSGSPAGALAWLLPLGLLALRRRQSDEA